MTKVPVNVPGFTPNMTYGAAKVQSAESVGEFGKIFENQKNVASEVKEPKEDTSDPQDNRVKDVESKDRIAGVNEAQGGENVKETAKPRAGQTASEDDSEGELSEEEMNLIMPMLQAAAGDIKDILAQELGISQEELDALMESMGITETDLLDQGVLKDLLLQANGITDMAELLTNEELYAQMHSLEGSFEEVMSNVQETLQMTDEEMNALKEQLANMSKEPVVTVETTASVESMAQKENGNEEHAAQNNPFATPNQNLVNAQENANLSATQTTSTSFMSAETENIMNQIMDYMKIQLNAETSTLEMQLQPESLGTLQVRIAAKEGIMTAQFTTASETVKAALESQILQLQQQFENQNIKVDAIEVTVQTHQFESALEQGNERQQAEDGKKNKARRIDLSRMEDAEEIPVEDKIVAEMMAANGNTVDYLA